MIKLAVDAMGGDNGSKIVVDAIKQYIIENPNKVSFVVSGDELELKELKGIAEIIPATEIMGMEDGALAILRRKETSMMKAIDACANGLTDGVISCGSTGAFLTLSTLKLKLIKGVSRAALATLFPTLIPKKFVLMLDLGASNENLPEHLVQFAEMGNIAGKKLLNKKELNVYLLSNGAEEKKGSPVSKAAHEIIKAKEYPWFKGNLEAKFVLMGDADVVACGGYEGNVLLKSIEGTATIMSKLIKRSFRKNILTKIGYIFAKSGFDTMQEDFNPKKGGGAMLLGINKISVKAHGNSDALAFKTGIEFAVKMIESKIIEEMKSRYEN